MPKTKTIIPIVSVSIILFLIVSFGMICATEYIVEEGSVCGDGLIVDGEDCDDGNIDNGDGCSSSCAIETGYTCTGEPSVCEEDSSPPLPPPSSPPPSGGGGSSDTTAPSITNIEESVTSNSISISWTTNESSISWVIYGLAIDYGEEVKTTEYVTSHSVDITNLSPETTYHYKIKSKDAGGNIGFSNDKTFTTLKEGEEVTGQLTIEQLKARIAEILALIAQLQVQLVQLQGVTGIPNDFKFENPLYISQNSEEVRYLQIFLNSYSDTCLTVQPGAWGSSGKESIYFGNATKSAVIKFQEKYALDILAPWGFTRGTGIVGPTTRAKINQLLGR